MLTWVYFLVPQFSHHAAGVIAGGALVHAAGGTGAQSPQEPCRVAEPQGVGLGD